MNSRSESDIFTRLMFYSPARQGETIYEKVKAPHNCDWTVTIHLITNKYQEWMLLLLNSDYGAMKMTLKLNRFLAVLPVRRFSLKIGLFFSLCHGKFSTVAGCGFFGQVLSKFMRFFGLLLLNKFSIIEYSFCRFCWGSENCFDFKQCDAGFVVRFCSLDLRTIIPSREITWSFVCDLMGNSVVRILTGQGDGLLWSHHTRGRSSQEV